MILSDKVTLEQIKDLFNKYQKEKESKGCKIELKKVLQDGTEKLKKIRVHFSTKKVQFNIKFVKYNLVEEGGDDSEILLRFEKKVGNELTFYNLIEKLKNTLKEYELIE